MILRCLAALCSQHKRRPFPSTSSKLSITSPSSLAISAIIVETIQERLEVVGRTYQLSTCQSTSKSNCLLPPFSLSKKLQKEAITKQFVPYAPSLIVLFSTRSNSCLSTSLPRTKFSRSHQNHIFGSIRLTSTV